MEDSHCIICSSKKTSPFIIINDRLNKSAKQYSLLKCTCGMVYLKPRPTIEDMQLYYKSEYYDPHNNSAHSLWGRIYYYVQKISIRWKYKILTTYIREGSLLDIGGGMGHFAKYIHNKGWYVRFQDNNTTLCSNADESLFVSELSDLNPNVKYDVITLWHSLEHIHNIRYLFKSLNNLLKDSGFLMIAVPNLDAPERRFYKENWAPYDAPRHLYHFNLDRLNELFTINGFDIIRKYSLYQDLPYNVLLSTPSYSLVQLVKMMFVIFYSFLYTLFRGPEFSSSILIICKKSS